MALSREQFADGDQHRFKEMRIALAEEGKAGQVIVLLRREGLCRAP
jgi:hypothetical protein